MANRLSVLRVTAAASIVVGLPALSGSTAHHGAAQAPPPHLTSASRGSAGAVPTTTVSPVPEMIEAAQWRIEQPAPSRGGPARRTSPHAPVTRLAPVTAIHSQAKIDSGALVTWTTSPTCLLAGHDTMGWAWLNDLPAGRVVRVDSGPCAGTYQVVGHRWQPRKGGTMPDWVSRYDLVLQTCTGRSGTGFSTARRLPR
ncbi:hypothetical protein AB0C01_31210 [Micromonospora sp. NPDC048905]|uniref:hypothetical protein n=1 Tax=unclassified Micromonospora TaxID=2617518 RepID=UPI0033D55288